MKKVITIVCLVWATSLTKAAVTIADWNFDNGTLTHASGNNTDYGHADTADAGISTVSTDASGHHVSTLVNWTLPAGNPGQSFSADHWAKNDYFQFSVSTVGYKNIQLNFDQISSSTGPGIFILEYSTTGTGGTFNNFGTDYTLTHTGFTVSSTTFTVDLSSVTGLNNDPSVVFRLVDDSTTSEGGGAIGSTGASHVDNFIVNGVLIPVPEPATWGLISGLGLLGLCGLRTWRERKPKAEN